MESSSPAAIFLSMRRMILPDRVLGKSEKTIKSGVAMGPMADRTAFFSDLFQIKTHQAYEYEAPFVALMERHCRSKNNVCLIDFQRGVSLTSRVLVNPGGHLVG
jgi:hypothetical protein